ncbi:MAG: nucleoside-diphosphate kinase [Candidatus Methanomethylicia archaeon]|jgi:nucleoside-diphosphate kinase|uniref:Nucleoside diphosphate kinase n=1 Tax=Thermoproteota archaeon TaxID=2056631 RepID=A0A523BFI9_9CREN|nr:nucleoside-diphosphate kinase [Candidatus Methanomethylicia archaeon]MCQ5373967.1 nucleoside-diphosphate kinase [Candidatus Methanomethylicia archaeon]TDA39726.1 MAG: nucleoside-diphosphate kinase [Candidatus Verstraetearchaeota archaeon]
MIERTFVMIKPDAVLRGLVGEVISRLERKGLKIVGMRMIKMSEEEASSLYSVHKGKPFYEDLIRFIRSAPVVVMAIEGESAISVVRRLIGPTDSKEAPPGTVRGDFSCSKSMNIIHASDSLDNAQRELSIFFKDSEVLSYSRLDESLVK